MIAEWSSGEWVLVLGSVIASLTTAIVSIIAAFKTNTKLDKIHEVANSLADKRVSEARESGDAQGRLHEKDAQQLRRDIRDGDSRPLPPGVPQNVKVVNPPSQPVPTIVEKDRDTDGI